MATTSPGWISDVDALEHLVLAKALLKPFDADPTHTVSAPVSDTARNRSSGCCCDRISATSRPMRRGHREFAVLHPPAGNKVAGCVESTRAGLWDRKLQNR